MIDDEQMARAAAELANAIYESSPEPDACTHKFSPRFEKKMERLIRKANHPAIYRALRTAACCILVIIIGFGSVLAVHAEERVLIAGWVKEKYENFCRYFFAGEADPAESVKYRPGWMPEGCVFVTSFEIEGGETFIYTDEQKTLIQFMYTSSTANTQVLIKEAGYDKKNVLINGYPGDIYISKAQNETNGIVWTDASENVLFFVSGDFTENELIKIAESVKES